MTLEAAQSENGRKRCAWLTSGHRTWDFSTDWSRGGDTLATPNLNGWPVQTAMNAASRTLKSQFHQFETQYLALTDGLVHVRLDR